MRGKLGFLGYGNMGSAILEGLLARGVIRCSQSLVFDPSPICSAAAERLGAELFASPEALARESDLLILAVKPQTMEVALSQVRSGFSPKTLVISIAAGISIGYIQRFLGAETRVIRVMPNTPALVQTGAAALAPSANCTDQDLQMARTIFESVGIVEIVSEKEIDVVTALSGSGPAYFFYMTECLIKAAVAEGLDEAVATRLATQTFMGAATLLNTRGESAASLRERVTSKGGTTEAALNRFRQDGFEAMILAGVRAAAARSRELGA